MVTSKIADVVCKKVKQFKVDVRGLTCLIEKPCSRSEKMMEFLTKT